MKGAGDHRSRGEVSCRGRNDPRTLSQGDSRNPPALAVGRFNKFGGTVTGDLIRLGARTGFLRMGRQNRYSSQRLSAEGDSLSLTSDEAC